MTDRALAPITRARKALAEAKTIPEIKKVRDMAQAATQLVQRQRLGMEAANDGMEIALLAERRLGGMLKKMQATGELAKRGGDQKSKSQDATLMLADLEISRTQSARWQTEAQVPEDDFQQWVRETREAGKLLTQTALIKLGRKEPTPTAVGKLKTGIVASLQELIDASQKFACIYADPPWKYGNQGTRAATDNHYSTMTVDEICAEPIAAVAADNAHLHLWTTNAFLFEAHRVIQAWGFEYKSCLVWVKPQMGIGNYWRVSHEFLLLGIKGRCPFLDRSQMSWVKADRTKHSRKPREIRIAIEKVSPNPRLEMYGRERLEGWTVYGNQIAPSLF